VEKNPKKAKSRVFLLDAHHAARQGLARLIEMEPDLIICGEAAGVEEALSGIGSTGPDVAVVSLEPLNDGGPEAVDRLRWANPALPLIVVSLREPVVHGRRMLQAGAAGYVMTARAFKEIVPAIRRVLKGGVYGKGGGPGRRR
jgi:DNA-binding NarL/FixJ family response regulator